MRMNGFGPRFASPLLGAALLAVAVVALGGSQAFAQGPASVPSFRAYGSCQSAGGSCPAGTTVTAVSATNPGTTCGTGTVTGAGSYFVDIQSIPGCSGTVTFTVNNQPTTNGPTSPPAVQGSPQQVNLVAGAATPTPPPPPPPAPVATPPPPPPPPPPAATAVVPAAPPNTGVGPGPARPVSQAPSVSAVPQLPNTGTGGLLDSGSAGVTPWMFLGLTLAAIALLGTSAFAYRRSR